MRNPRLNPSATRAVLSAAAAAGATAAVLVVASSGSAAARSTTTARSKAPKPPTRLIGYRLGARPHAVQPGTSEPQSNLFADRVFVNRSDGITLASVGSAQYPARSTDGGRTWRIDGPQFHVDAADAPQGVGAVGLESARTLFAYGSSVVDVTTNGGRSWYETYLGENVAAVVAGSHNQLVAYVQQQVNDDSSAPASPVVTWQYVSTDGGRDWRYNTYFGGS